MTQRGLGGKPNRIEAFAVGLAPSTVVEEVQGFVDPSADSNAATTIRADAVDRYFDDASSDDHSLVLAEKATRQEDAVANRQASPAAQAVDALDAATDRSESEVVDNVIAELSKSLSLPLEESFFGGDL